jgi:hypothetical protein
LDARLDALSGTRRRLVVHYFVTTGRDAAPVEDVVSHLVEREGTAGDRERTLVGLHHVTLPKLEEAGVVEYDARTETVRYRGDPLVEECLRLVIEREGVA